MKILKFLSSIFFSTGKQSVHYCFLVQMFFCGQFHHQFLEHMDGDFIST